MGKTAEGKLQLKAVDKMSRVIDSAKAKFPQLSKAVRKSAQSFRIAQRRSESFSKSARKIGGGMKNIGQSMTRNVSLPVAAFSALAVRTGVSFEKSMNKVSALTGSTGKDLGKMRDMAKSLGSSTAFSASQAADAMAFFGQAGFKANEILAATPATLDLAAAAGHDLAGTADILSNIMGGFGQSADMAGKSADMLAFTAAKGNVNLEMLGETFKDAGPAAFAAGNQFSTVAALTAKLGDAGIQGSKAGTTLKQMFNTLSGPTKRVKDIMKALGVQAVDPVSGKLRDMSHILLDMNKAFQGKGIKGAKKLAVLNEIFGARAVAGSSVLLNNTQVLDKETGKYKNSIEELSKAMETKGIGSAKRMAETMNKGLGGAFTKLGSAFEGLQLAFLDLKFGGKTVTEIVVSMVESLTSFFQGLSTTNKGMFKTIAVLAGVAAIAGPVLVAFGTFITFLPMMVTGFNLFVGALVAVKVAAAGALVPLLPYVALVGLLAYSAYKVYKAWKPIKQFFSDIWNKPIEMMDDMIRGLTEITGLGKLFGMDSADDVDAKLKAQGFKIQEQGQPAGAQKALDKSAENKKRERKAMLDISFANMPRGAVMVAEDKSSIIDNLTGDMSI